MKDVDDYLKVRHAVRIEGLSERAVARRFGIDPRTVHKGATVTDNLHKNLRLKTFLNGTLVFNIVIDTSQIATDTMDYVATTATSTRTVIIEPVIEATTSATSTQ